MTRQTLRDRLISVRRANEGDAETLAECNVECWRAAYSSLVPADFLEAMSVGEQAARFRRFLTPDTDAEVWLAEDDRRLLGYASLGPSRDEQATAGGAELYALYVRPDAWRRGLGRLLHERALERLRARGATLATLWVFEDNRRARAFYEALDWTRGPERRELELAGSALSVVRYTRPLDDVGAPGTTVAS